MHFGNHILEFGAVGAYILHGCATDFTGDSRKVFKPPQAFAAGKGAKFVEHNPCSGFYFHNPVSTGLAEGDGAVGAVYHGSGKTPGCKQQVASASQWEYIF